MYLLYPFNVSRAAFFIIYHLFSTTPLRTIFLFHSNRTLKIFFSLRSINRDFLLAFLCYYCINPSFFFLYNSFQLPSRSFCLQRRQDGGKEDHFSNNKKKKSVFIYFLFFSISKKRALSLSLWEGGKSGIYLLYRQFFSAFSSPAVYYSTAALCRHPDPEAMSLRSFSVIRLISSFHV